MPLRRPPVPCRMSLAICMTTIIMAIAASGCGLQDVRSAATDSVDSITAAALANITNVRKSLEKVKDEESATAAAEEINAAADTAAELAERAGQLESPTDEEIKAVQEKYGEQFKAEGNRMAELLLKIHEQRLGTPQLYDALENLKASSQRVKNATGTGSSSAP